MLKATEIVSLLNNPQIGYPNEPGILRGVAQRAYRALKQLGRRGVEGGETQHHRLP